MGFESNPILSERICIRKVLHGFEFKYLIGKLVQGFVHIFGG